MEQRRNGERKSRKGRKRKHAPVKPSAGELMEKAADTAVTQCVETYLPAQLSFVDDDTEEVGI